MKESKKYLSDNYWNKFGKELPELKKILEFKEKVSLILDSKHNKKLWKGYKNLPNIKADNLIFDKNSIEILSSDKLSDEDHQHLKVSLETLIPWRKGPFNFFGIEIDSEWKSNLKWDRVKDHIDIDGKKIVDIGCNNSYYMYRMLENDPKFVVGFDPMARYYFYHLYLDKYIKDERVKFELFGVDELSMFPNFYDTVLFMGVLYHRREPLKTLKIINDSLVDDGQIIIECMGIPGEGDMCLFPEERYTKSVGYWFLPTVGALRNMLKRTNFCNIEIIDVHKLTTDEQRNTKWVQRESLKDFLDPNDDSKTIEGYPAPIRIYMKARKKYNKQIHKYK